MEPCKSSPTPPGAACFHQQAGFHLRFPGFHQQADFPTHYSGIPKLAPVRPNKHTIPPNAFFVQGYLRTGPAAPSGLREGHPDYLKWAH